MPPIVSGLDYLALPRSPDTWLVEGLLPVGGTMLLYGDPKIGKSYAAIQLACNLSTGTPWLGFRVPQPIRVVYIQLDTPRSLWAERVDALRRSGYPIGSLYLADRETLEAFPFNIFDSRHALLLKTALEGIAPGAVVLDTIREVHQLDEDKSTPMQAVIAQIDAVVKPSALILIAHARKPNPEHGRDLLNDNRGSNYIVGRMDAVCRFSHSTIRCISRTLEEHSINLDRRDDGTWEVADDPFYAVASRVMEEYKGRPIREMARILHDRSSRSESACRAFLRRAAQALSHGEKRV